MLFVFLPFVGKFVTTPFKGFSSMTMLRLWQFVYEILYKRPWRSVFCSLDIPQSWDLYWVKGTNLFRTCNVKVSKVDTHAPFIWCLPYQDHVSQPKWVFYLCYETDACQLLYLFINSHSFFLIHCIFSMILAWQQYQWKNDDTPLWYLRLSYLRAPMRTNRCSSLPLRPTPFPHIR